MKESHGEGVADHTGPESCVVIRKGGGEALTGEGTGRVLSRERGSNGSADPVQARERPHRAHREGERREDCPWSETPRMCGSSLSGNRESLPLALRDSRRARVANPEGRRRR